MQRRRLNRVSQWVRIGSGQLNRLAVEHGRIAMSRKLTAIAAVMLVACLTVLPAERSAADDRQAVRAAVNQWFVVLNAMLNGDPKPFADLYSHADDTYYMGAEGTYRIGWEAIYRDWKEQAAKSTGGKVDGVKIQVTVAGDMAMAAHVTRGAVQSDGKTVEVAARETSVFRKEEGRWRMIGHHADGLQFWEEAFRN
jgi:uncharacterized protein (TIGR02246 family)